MALTESQKSELMRKGNVLFNEGRYFDAGRIFTLIGYKTGLIRLGDLFYFDKEMPLVAYGFYRSAKHQPMLDKINDGFVFALECLLSEDGGATPQKTSPTQEETYKIRTANPSDAVDKVVQESRESKINRAVAMLKKLS
ncbi:MAG: hypothetical protein LDLANPLL_02770 [Turneriella sp.]|nr:hypothetical protein [Turneriella sp.]